MTPKNGYVPAALLVQVEGVLLARDTAAAYNRAKAAAASQGIKVSIALPAGGYRSYAVQADMHVHPGNYNLDPTSTAGLAAAGHSGHGLGNRVDINGGAGREWFIEHGHEFGFVQEFGSRDPGHFENPTETWPTASGAVVVPAVTGWSPGQTDFKGAYGRNDLHGASWYCIEPATTASKTIYGVAEQAGVSLDDVRAWTAKVKASKWAGQLLQPGSSWWDGSGTYYAGVCIALNDVAAALDAYEAQQLAAQQAAVAAAQAEADSSAAATAAVAAQLNAQNVAASAAVKAGTGKSPERLTQKQLDAYAAKLGVVPFGSMDANASAPLAGLFAGHDLARRRTYLVFAAWVLMLSLGPDIVTFGVLTGQAVPEFVKWVNLATSATLKIGGALGFIAASNTSK